MAFTNQFFTPQGAATINLGANPVDPWDKTLEVPGRVFINRTSGESPVPNQVPANIERMYKELAELDMALCDLFNRLAPVTGPMKPQGVEDEAQKTAMSTLAETLFQLNAKISDITANIRYVIAAIEL